MDGDEVVDGEVAAGTAATCASCVIGVVENCMVL